MRTESTDATELMRRSSSVRELTSIVDPSPAMSLRAPSSTVPASRACSTSRDSDDSEDERYSYLPFSARMDLARSERASYYVEGRPLSSNSRKRIAELSDMYGRCPGMFFIAGARWNRIEETDQAVIRKAGKAKYTPLTGWWAVAGTEVPPPSHLRQDFSRETPADEEEYARWEEERLSRQAVPRTTLGGHKATNNTIKATTSLPAPRLPPASDKLASSSTSRPLKRARTESVAPRKETSQVRLVQAVPPPAAAPVARTASVASSSTSSKRLKNSSSHGSSTTTASLFFPITKRASISPTETTTGKLVKPKPSTPRQPSPPVPGPSHSSPPPAPPREELFSADMAREDLPASPGRASDGREKGKARETSLERAESYPVEDYDEGRVEDVSMLEEDGVEMRGIRSGWDGDDADTSAFDMFLPPSFPKDLACSTPHGKPSAFYPPSSQLSANGGPTSSPHFPPKSTNKPLKRLSELDAVEAKRKKSSSSSKRSRTNTDETTTTSTNTTATPTATAPLPASTITAALLAVETLESTLSSSQPRPSTLAVPMRLGLPSRSGSFSAGASGPPSSSFGGTGTSVASLGEFNYTASQFEGQMGEISNFLQDEEDEVGSLGMY